VSYRSRYPWTIVMPDLVPWLDYVMSKADDLSDDADGFKAVATAIAYLADENGVVTIEAIEDHYELARGSMAGVFDGAEYLVLRLPE
jgi:hypothetical protein